MTGTETPYACNVHAEGAIDLGGDNDAYAFALAVDSSIQAFTGPSIAGALSDTFLEIYDSLGVLIVSNDDARGLYSVIDASLPAGSYFLNVRAFGATQVGGYTLDLACEPSIPLAPVPEGAEPNGDPLGGGTPTATACFTLNTGDLDALGGDSDYYSFTLSGATTVRGATAPDGLTPVSDTTLELFDSAGVSIAFNDDGGPGLYSLIDASLAAGTYYFDVRAFGATQFGGYTLSIICGLPAPIVATYSTTTSSCVGTNGTPSLTAGDLEVLRLGSTMRVEIGNCPPSSVLIPFIGFSNTISGSGVPLPFDLAPLGAAGCTVDVDPAASFVAFADASGNYEWCLQIPAFASLAGIDIYQQVFVLDGNANGLGATTTNSGGGTVGNDL